MLILEFRLVTVHVRLFAGLRERAGWSAREIQARTVADVWPALGLGDEPEGLLYAVNREYAERDRELRLRHLVYGINGRTDIPVCPLKK